MRRVLSSLLAISLALVSCTSGGPSADTTTPPRSASLTVQPTTSTVAVPVLTLAEQEPPVFTEFATSRSCDPTSEIANLEVIQAFVTAYNERDETRLTEFIADAAPVADMSGIAHLGEDDWVGVEDWARAGWAVDDRFELLQLVMFGSGSVFEVARSNDVLASAGIDTLRHRWKVHSFRCSISQMVLYLPGEEAGVERCRFWEAFGDDLVNGTTQPIEQPESCSG